MFPVHSEAVLHLNENGNGDICVAAYTGKAVVVMDSSGNLRFTYRGNTMKQLKNKLFTSSKIVNDNKLHILINDKPRDIVHKIDCDGNFIRYIEYPCTGGISVDTDCNLVVGEKKLLGKFE